MNYSVVHWINNENKEKCISTVTGLNVDFCNAIILCRKITDDGMAVASEIRMEDEEETAVSFYDGENFVIHTNLLVEKLYSKERVQKFIKGNEKILELHNDDTSFTVGFSHFGTWIHNPFYSDCYRFEVDPVEYYGADFLNSSFIKSKWDEPFEGVYLKDFADKITPETKYAIGVNSETITLYRHPSEFLIKYGWDEQDEVITIPCSDVENIYLEELNTYISLSDIYKVASCYYEYCIRNNSHMSSMKL